MTAAFSLYLALGVAFAVLFIARIAPKVDPGARDGSWGFRIIILPAAVALWPALLCLSLRKLCSGAQGLGSSTISESASQ